MVNIEQKLDMLKSIKPDCVVIGYVENLVEENLWVTVYPVSLLLYWRNILIGMDIP